MAKNTAQAPVTNQVETGANVSDASQEAIAAQAAKVAADKAAADEARSDMIASLTFVELFAAIKQSARWNDVLNAADDFAGYCSEGKDGKPAGIARKAAGIAPSRALALRLALATYQLSGRNANATQLAELSSKLPLLRTSGHLKDKAVTFGGIVLPPIAGEL